MIKISYASFWIPVFIFWLCPFAAVRGGQNTEASKIGGVCFRFDDMHSIKQWSDLARLFDKYGFPMALAVNSEGFTAESGHLLAGLSKIGHEIMDHSPSHAMYNLRCQNKEEFENAKKLPFIAASRAGSMWVFFKYEFKSGHSGNIHFIGSVNGNNLTVAAPEIGKRFHHSSKIYIPDLNKVYGIRIKQGKKKLFTFWGTGGVDLNISNKEMILCSDLAFHPANGVLQYLAKRSKQHFIKYGIKTPITFCQPGGWEPFLTVEEVESVYGKEYSYKCGSCVYQVWPWFNCFNDPIPQRYRFAMRSSDHSFDGNDIFHKGKSIQCIKKRIVDCVAKHRVQIFLSHMKSNRIDGGWTGWLKCYDQLLAWLKAKEIPVKTMAEWSDTLYSHKSDPNVNIMPSLKTDLNDDGIPDGYELNGEVKTDLANGKLHLEKGGSAEIYGLAGIEKGCNQFAFSCKGEKNSKIIVEFSPIHHRSTKPFTQIRKEFILLANSEKQYATTINIPADTVVMNVKYYADKAVKISSLQFCK